MQHAHGERRCSELGNRYPHTHSNCHSRCHLRNCPVGRARLEAAEAEPSGAKAKGTIIRTHRPLPPPQLLAPYHSPAERGNRATAKDRDRGYCGAAFAVASRWGLRRASHENCERHSGFVRTVAGISLCGQLARVFSCSCSLAGRTAWSDGALSHDHSPATDTQQLTSSLRAGRNHQPPSRTGSSTRGEVRSELERSALPGPGSKAILGRGRMG